MLSLKYSNRFKKDLKLYQYDRVVLSELEKVLDFLVQEKKLPLKNANHRLVGEFKDCFECHIKPDVLLIYKIQKSEVVVLLLRIGSHATLF
ncbi:MAG: type II toxin-antitoxin system YafQ family toxin [Patescibacteria group bacterium]|jgi:mRNA interferase YafQ